ncbi:MAG: glycosyltransferase family 1 protein [Candidatus Falkowbacteria bacterium]
MNTPLEKNRTIGIDARFYGPLGKGLGRYTQEIVDNVITLSNDTSVNYVIFLSVDNFDEFICPNTNVRKELIKSRWYTLAEQFEVPYRWRRARLDLMHFPHFNVPLIKSGAYVVTIHDLILTKFPTHRASTLHPFIYWLKDKAYRLIISSAVKYARKIITVSEFTKLDLMRQFKVMANKIVVTYEGVANLAKGNDSLFVAKLDNKKTLALYNIHGPFLLYVGNAYPHKNLEGLVTAFAKLRIMHPDLRLVLVGKEDYFYNRVKEIAHSNNLWQKENHNSPVVFTGYVPDVDLEALFQEATLYVFPSLYEGFGLPPLEAMAHNCPVISSDRASMPEVLGDAALYFNPEDKDDIIRVIESVLNNESERQHLIDLGLKRVKKYSWWECARMTSEIYNQILRNKK